MEKAKVMDEDTQATVKKFCERVIWLRVIHRIYEELFADVDSQKMMEKTAPSFFHDLNNVVVDYLLLQFAKITDPAATGCKENLTVDYLVNTIQWTEEWKKQLIPLRDRAMKLRPYLKDGRNRILAHSDLKTTMTGEKLGGFPEGEDKEFLDALENLCNLAYKGCFSSVFGKISVGTAGDVLDFKKVLRKALAFDKALTEHGSDEKAKLLEYLSE